MGRKGLTLIELLVVIAIISILAAAAMPLSSMTVRRAKEIELRQSLRAIRNAIDAFNRDCTEKVLAQDHCTIDQENYPATLEQLTEPLALRGSQNKTKKYLRRIPRDPMASRTVVAKDSWGLRSYGDDPDSTIWGGNNVYDVYSKSDAEALDGTKYSSW